MAKIIQKYNSLKAKSNFNLTIAIIFFIITLIFMYKHMSPDSSIRGLPTILGFAISGGIGRIFLDKYLTLRSGVKGESYARGLLKSLPNTYTVYSEVDINFEGKKSQIDNIIVGPNGVFVVEVKNASGDIYGAANDQFWTQQKVGRKGGRYAKKFYNPIKQVGTHVYRTAQLLKQNHFNVWVQGIVYFTNPATGVYVNDDRIPVFSAKEGNGRDLIDYIESYKARTLLSEKDRYRIVQLFDRL